MGVGSIGVGVGVDGSGAGVCGMGAGVGGACFGRSGKCWVKGLRRLWAGGRVCAGRTGPPWQRSCFNTQPDITVRVSALPQSVSADLRLCVDETTPAHSPEPNDFVHGVHAAAMTPGPFATSPYQAPKVATVAASPATCADGCVIFVHPTTIFTLHARLAFESGGLSWTHVAHQHTVRIPEHMWALWRFGFRRALTSWWAQPFSASTALC